MTVEVWDEQRIADERLGGLLGVARGSTQPPRLVRVEYRPADPIEIDGRVPHLALVGKGITFDSGGLSLKTADRHGDHEDRHERCRRRAGRGRCRRRARCAHRITAIAPLTENMPGGSATKPGDVLTIRNGKTIEVLNTDAEGRLVLADGLSLAAEAEPDAIVDLATLTGAAVVALGKEIAGLFGNDEVLCRSVRAAGTGPASRSWPLPLPDDYRSPHRLRGRRHEERRPAGPGRHHRGRPAAARVRRRRARGPISTSPARPAPTRTAAT